MALAADAHAIGADAARAANCEGVEGMLAKVLGLFAFHFTIAMVLSIVMGLLLEKWRYGAVQNLSRAIGSGASILFTNFFIAWAGCTAITHL